MKKLKALSRAAVSMALVLGTSFAPFALTTGVAHASTPLYWYGTGTNYPGTNTNTATAAAGTSTNWSTSNSAYVAAPSSGSWADNAVLTFSTGTTAQTVTGQVTGTPAGIEVVTGGITLSGNTTSNVQALQPGSILKVDTPSTATNFLKANYVATSGALTLDGVKPADFPSGNTGGVTGPLTVQVSDNTVTTPTNYTYTATHLTQLLGAASSGNGKTVEFGPETALTLGATDFSTNATYWTIKVSKDSPTGTRLGAVNLTGSTATGGTTYLETIIGNGGIVGVTGGTANVATVTLNADSVASTPGATDVLGASTFNDNGFSFSKASVSDAGTFPTVTTGTGSGNGTGTGAGGLTDTTTTPDATTPAPATPARLAGSSSRSPRFWVRTIPRARGKGVACRTDGLESTHRFGECVPCR